MSMQLALLSAPDYVRVASGALTYGVHPEGTASKSACVASLALRACKTCAIGSSTLRSTSLLHQPAVPSL